MADKRFNYKPIYPGFPWELTVRFDAGVALFPEGTRLRAQIRDEPGSATLGLIGTEAGGIERVDDATLTFRLDPALTLRFKGDSVAFDLVRLTAADPEHLGIRVTAKVKTSLTAAR